MSDIEKSSELYAEGDELAKIAVHSKMAIDQLRTIYQMVKVKPLVPMLPLTLVRAHIKRQIVRVSGRAAFRKILELIDKYRNDRKALEEILAYSLYLYDFHRQEKVINMIESTMPIIRRLLEKHRLKLYDIWIRRARGNVAEIEVIVDRDRVDKRRIASEIRDAIMKKSGIYDLSLKIWIEST